jgi:hypothetical protein
VYRLYNYHPTTHEHTGVNITSSPQLFNTITDGSQDGQLTNKKNLGASRSGLWTRVPFSLQKNLDNIVFSVALRFIVMAWKASM